MSNLYNLDTSSREVEKEYKCQRKMTGEAMIANSDGADRSA